MFRKCAPEEFFVNTDARTMEDAYMVAQNGEMRAGDVVAMGFDPEVIYELDGLRADLTSETEVFERQGYDEDYGESDEIIHQ